jgi:hypothetical protein
MKRPILLTSLVAGALGVIAQSGGTDRMPAFKGPRTHAPGTFGPAVHQTAPNSFQSARATAFWSEDFSGGAIPSGWTNEDNLTPSGTPEVTFVWADDPGAVGVASLGYVPSSVFGGSSAGNGYLWANSDRGLTAAPGTDHLTQLTTGAIDCSNQSSVLFTMESLVGVFDYDGSTNVRLNVSTDGVTWTSFAPFPCLETGAAAPPCVRWSANPQFVAIDISSVAANQATVYLRFEWLGGWEYFWAIDDLNLSPVPEFELVMDYGVLSHTGTGEEYGRIPASQLNPTMLVGGTFLNNGASELTDVNVVMEVRKTSARRTRPTWC